MLTVACGHGHSTPTSPGSVSTTPGPTPTAPAALLTFQIGAPDTFVGGQITQALVTLTTAAPSGGFPLTLASDSAAATVPTSVTVPAGTTSLIVPVQTHALDTATTANISATGAGTSRSAALSLGAGTFLSFASSSGDSIGGNRSRRYSAAESGFVATVSAALDTVTVDVKLRDNSGIWHLVLDAPAGQELRSGVYSSATRYNAASSTAGLEFSGFGRICSSLSGSFTIADVKYGQDSTGKPTLERLFATFTQTCTGGTPLDGEVLIAP